MTALPVVVDPTLTLRWLSQARRAVVVAQLLLLGVARLGTDVRVPLTPVLGVLALMLAVDVAVVLQQRRIGPRWVGALVGFDLLALTALLLLTGGAQNPLQAFYLVEVALLAIVLPRGAAWAATAGTLALHALATLLPLPVIGLDEEPHHHGGHMVGHLVAFDLAALAVSGFVGRVSAQLRDREASLRASEAGRERGERLAALGTLAAGTAHALGTPLGAIELLAEEMAHELPAGEGRAAHVELVAQVRRCRAILDRMLAGDGGAEGRTDDVASHVAAWVQAWRAGQAPELAVTFSASPGACNVRGEADGWRDALWTLLDNARTAGGPITVTFAPSAGGAVLCVEDSGPVVSAGQIARAGQPFFSAWPDRKGAGLGLYVARTFARATGGDVTLQALSPQGVRAVLTMTEAE